MKSKRMLRIMSFVIVLSMIFTTVAFATPGNKKHKHFSKEYELDDDDYEDALRSLIEKEIVKGYGKGEYGLSGNVKRGDVIVMIVRMLDKYNIIDQDDYDDEELGDNYLKIFNDVDYTEYYYGPIKIAKKFNIAKGDGLYFKPNKPVTIQETIWLIERAGDLLDIDDFDSEKIDELEAIYEGELNEFAKRRDVFWMLYYVLDEQEVEDDEDDVEFKDIKLDMGDDDQLDFNDSWFIRAYNAAVTDKDKDSLEYVKFSIPKDGGKLYYEYDDEKSKNTLVLEKYKYYLGDDEDNIVEEISFVPNKNYSGTTTIEYTAYTEEEESFSGLIKITVDNENLENLSYKVKENEYVKFDKDDFEDFIDGVKLEIPNSKVGTLYFDRDKDGKPESGEVISKSTVYERDQLDYIIFKPYQNFKGEAVVKYAGYEYLNDGDEAYYGEIKITVEAAQEIPTLKFSVDYDDEKIDIKFNQKLNDLIANDKTIDFDDLDYVKFQVPENGTLKIKLDNRSSLINVDEKDSYELDDIEYIRYVFDEDENTNINYTVYDETTKSDDKPYRGLFVIEMR